MTLIPPLVHLKTSKEVKGQAKALFTQMKKYYTDAQIVEISSVVGLFNFINRFNDSLGVLPDEE